MSANYGYWELVVPEAPAKEVAASLPPRPASLAGKRIGLFWNTKPNGDVFLKRIGELLLQQFEDVKLVEFMPGNPDGAAGAPASSLKEAASACDLVILATGD